MKLGQLVAALMIISMVLVPAAPPATHAASGSTTEGLTVYIAGSHAAWFLSLGAVNVSNRYVSAAESTQGVTWYNLTAIDTTGWTSDLQVFGPQGYNVIPLPFVPLQGAFLVVGASTYAAAAAAAGGFGSYLLTSFSSLSNSSGVFTFFAPFNFKALAPSTILALVPFNSTGFTGPLTETKFEALPSQLVTLEGMSGASGFTHGIVLGSIASNALDSASRPNILHYFGSTPRFIQASNASTSSTITLHFLDGVALSSDNATVASDRGSFTGSYSLRLKPGERVYSLNATLIQQPAQLLATRVIDVGVLAPGSNMSVTLSLTNLSNSTSITGITLSDDWWQASGLFKLVSGSCNVTGLSLGPGRSATPTYVLQYLATGAATGPFLMPATLVSYSQVSGGLSFDRYTALNPITISLAVDQPVVYAYLSPSGGEGKGVGASQQLKVFVKNVGTRTASSVEVAGQKLGGLAPGDSTSAAVSVTAPSLSKVNVTKSFQVSYLTPGGASLNASTNALPVVFSHNSMAIAFGTLSLNSTVRELPTGGWSLNLTMDFANLGTGTVGSFAAEAQLPAGLGCGRAGGTNLTCSNGMLSLNYSGVISKGQEHAWMLFNVTQARSYIFGPFNATVLTSGFSLAVHTNAQPAPTGLLLSKRFDPSPLFTGMSSTVTVLASNGGPYNLYNATLSTVADSFDQVAGNAGTAATRGNITAGSSFNYTYGVRAVVAGRNALTTAVAASFYLGGNHFSIVQEGPRVSVFELVSASVTSSPSTPVEGRPFAILVTLTNPAAVAVENVQFFLPIPSGVSTSGPVNGTVSGGGLRVSLPQLGAGATYGARVNATASSGQTIPFKGTTLTFGYGGATLSGKVPTTGIAVSENVLYRYELPMALVFLAMLATAIYIRRIVRTTSPSSQS